ncbi:MAG: hypothetical protein Q4E06_10690 [Lautropia sp.]|nr:hypothetical protein [Lautropia sp.]
MASATSYKAIDPIVFSVTGAYRVSRRYGHTGDTRRNGNLLMLAPSVGFAVDKQV